MKITITGAMIKMKNIDEIAKDYTDGKYKAKIEYSYQSKFKDNHIFDEEQSVKWNKEEVIKRNNEIDLSRKVYSEEQNKMNDKLKNDVVNNLVYDYSINKGQAQEIYDKAYQDKHSSMNDVFYYAAELAELFEKLITIKE